MLLLINAKIIQCIDKNNAIDGSILIKNDRIEKIITDNNDLDKYINDENIEVVSCADKYLMPGMINCHVHIFMESETWDRKSMFEENSTSMTLNALRRMEQLLKSGVTYFRDCGGYRYLDLDLLEKITDEKWNLAGFIAAGDALCITGGHTWWMSRQCDGEGEFVKGVRENVKKGADFIKLMVTGGYARQKMRVNHNLLQGAVQMTKKEIEAAVYEAHRHGKKVAAHCIGLEGVKMAVESSVDSVEHAQFHDPYDKQVDYILEMMLEKGTYVVPTLAAYYKNYNKADVIEQYRAVDLSFKRYYDAGINIAMGTDAGCPFVAHDRSADELKHQIDAGMKPIESILSATDSAAKLLGINNDYGTLEEGKIADILVLNDNPVGNIDTLKSIDKIYKNGKLFRSQDSTKA